MNYFVGDEHRRYSPDEAKAKLDRMFPEHAGRAWPERSKRFTTEGYGDADAAEPQPKKPEPTRIPAWYIDEFGN